MIWPFDLQKYFFQVKTIRQVLLKRTLEVSLAAWHKDRCYNTRSWVQIPLDSWGTWSLFQWYYLPLTYSGRQVYKSACFILIQFKSVLDIGANKMLMTWANWLEGTKFISFLHHGARDHHLHIGQHGCGIVSVKWSQKNWLSGLSGSLWS